MAEPEKERSLRGFSIKRTSVRALLARQSTPREPSMREPSIRYSSARETPTRGTIDQPYGAAYPFTSISSVQADTANNSAAPRSKIGYIIKCVLVIIVLAAILGAIVTLGWFKIHRRSNLPSRPQNIQASPFGANNPNNAIQPTSNPNSPNTADAGNYPDFSNSPNGVIGPTDMNGQNGQNGPIAPTGNLRPITAIDGDSSFIGNCDDIICSWLGVRYGIVPNRFSPPYPSPPAGQNYAANKMGPACPQASNTEQQDENCLFLNIERPQNIPLAIPLPVLVFFHGGEFEKGSSSSMDPTELIKISLEVNQPVIVIRVNYRLGLFGFLAGSELATVGEGKDVALNRGIRDMNMATYWCKQHIGAFGGDPNRIIIWGQASGAFGASALILGNPANPPFQGAILQSGSPGGIPIDIPGDKDAQYQRVLAATNCQGAADKVDCLRSISWEQLRDISASESELASKDGNYARGTFAWSPTMDGGPTQRGFYTSRPSAVIAHGEFARVPVLQGDCMDEGTIFTPHNLNTPQDLGNWLSSSYFSSPDGGPANPDTINKILQAYPDNPPIGSPYYPATNDFQDRFYGQTSQYKRAASIYGDLRYESNRRLWLAALSNNNVRAYSYNYAQQDQSFLAPDGVPQGADIAAILQKNPNPISKPFARYILAFATNLDPSTAGQDLPTWPIYTTSNPTLLKFKENQIREFRDNYRSDAMNLLNSDQVLLPTGR